MNNFEQHISDTQIALRLQIQARMSELENVRGNYRDRVEAVIERQFWEKELSKIYVMR